MKQRKNIYFYEVKTRVNTTPFSVKVKTHKTDVNDINVRAIETLVKARNKTVFLFSLNTIEGKINEAIITGETYDYYDVFKIVSTHETIEELNSDIKLKKKTHDKSITFHEITKKTYLSKTNY